MSLFFIRSHFIVDLFFKIMLFSPFNLVFKLFLCNGILFGPNSRIIKSNLLNKNKIKRHKIKVEKTLEINDDFKVYTKSLI